MKKNLLRKLDLPNPDFGEIVNQYKRRDVFRCTHDTHLHFEGAVSVFHVLKEKQCYPQGCIFFRWKCRQFDKGGLCPRKFKHVGRPCASCRHFYDIKVIRRPEVLLSADAFRHFQQELKEFEGWIERRQGRLVEFSGRVNSVKPRYSLTQRGKNPRIVFNGFILNFLDGTINRNLLKDFVYVSVTTRQQGRHRFAKGDSVAVNGSLAVKDGIMVLQHIRSVEVLEKAAPGFWTESRARVAQRTGTVLERQDPKCYSCERGTLVQVSPEDDAYRGARRKMFCLEGVREPAACCYTVHKCLARNS